MATLAVLPMQIQLPKLPGQVKDFISYFSTHPNTSVTQLLEPYKEYESELRKVYAQQPEHEAAKDGYVNAVPIFMGYESELKIRARQLASESPREKEAYLMPLDDNERKSNGTPAIIKSLKEFQNNFNLFSESSLSELDWNNVVAAGSAVTTALLPVPEKWSGSKRTLREYYHEHLAPASDVDLFLYGLNEKEALEKIKQIETSIKDSILHETTTIRTKNAITIASQHPTRHVQIVLRLYDSVSQIITGFDVDCACAAYDGRQVYASPRALAAFATQINTIDLSRRSPSYENRLSKYSHRGFEVLWSPLDRSRVDPTIFERSFRRTNGLARLLVLEKLPKTSDRESYMDQRRVERGRPPANRSLRDKHRLWGNIKDAEEDDVAEWVEEEEISNYHTMVVPYGKRFNASKINKLLYTKDLLLNAEWNKSKEREVNLHRHPCFFGSAEDILGDCCGFCPAPQTDEEREVAKDEDKAFVSGNLTFIKDDPGRQEIGSFNPVTTNDWSEMAYVGNTQILCQAIVDGDVDFVQSWCKQEGNDPSTRDYCGRTPLHLAVIAAYTTGPPPEREHHRNPSLEIVQCLIDNNARLVARLVDGRTALHLAAAQGNVEIVKALMQRSFANEDEETEREEKRKALKKEEKENAETIERLHLRHDSIGKDDTESGKDMSDRDDSDRDSVTLGSFIKIKDEKPVDRSEIPEDTDEPDFYNIDVLAWDFQASPLHMAIINGHVEMIRLLVQDYGADVLLPIKLVSQSYAPKAAILSLILPLFLPAEKAKEVTKVLLELGATCAQADTNHFTSLHYIIAGNNPEILDVLFEQDGPAARQVLNYVSMGASHAGSTALTIALGNCNEVMVSKLRSLGAKSTIPFDDYIKSYIARFDYAKQWNPEHSLNIYNTSCFQPLLLAAIKEMPRIMEDLVKDGADPTMLNTTAYKIIKDSYVGRWQKGASVVDIVRDKLKALKDYKEDEGAKKPEQLHDENFYVVGLTPGSYKHWIALHCYRQAKTKFDTDMAEFKKLAAKAMDMKGRKEKTEAVAKLIEEFEEVEKKLVDAGAKGFRELHPTAPEYEGYQNRSYRQTSTTPFATTLTFSVPFLDDAIKESYFKLFEAAWTNNIEQVKALTLGVWKSKEDNKENQPLKIAVVDGKGFSPFSIAVLRGHYKLGHAIMEIALAQYEPEDKPTRKEHWKIDCDESESDSSSDFDGPKIYSDIIDDNFTIENVAAISTSVKSRIYPLTMIGWHCNADWFMDDHKLLSKDLTHRPVLNLINYAVQNDNLNLLRYLNELWAEYSALRVDKEESSLSTIVDVSTFNTAIQLGRTAILGELIKTTGAGIPLDQLVEKSGVEIERPRYYQGLNVGGKKRIDWAQAGRNQHVTLNYQNDQQTPLLRSAYFGSIDSLQWFLSDTPARRYAEFAAANKSDKRVKTLEQSANGFEKTIGTWLDSRSELSLHCAILWNPSQEKVTEYVSLVKYLISVMPESLEHRSVQGFTPLHLAAAVQRPEIVGLLITAGANQRVRDLAGRNMIHIMLVPQNAMWNNNFMAARFKPDNLRAMLAQFNKRHAKEMLLERCNLGPRYSSLTPLAYWLSKNVQPGGLAEHRSPEIVKILVEHSHGEDLDLINGEGDLPLHQAVKQSAQSISSFLITTRPELLHRENATGRTPLEMASDLYLQDRVSHPLQIQENHCYTRDSSCDLIKRPASAFVSGNDQNLQAPSKKRTFEVCMEAAKQFPVKRRLVSLFEANEVAKRLASLKTKSDVEATRGEHRDEVTQWLVRT